MNGQDLKARRNKLRIIRRHFANLLGVTEEKLDRWENGKTTIPPHVEQTVESVEERLNKRMQHTV